eukprot:124088-Chlamydomonas_euryale.AAC.8
MDGAGDEEDGGCWRGLLLAQLPQAVHAGDAGEGAWEMLARVPGSHPPTTLPYLAPTQPYLCSATNPRVVLLECPKSHVVS